MDCARRVEQGRDQPVELRPVHRFDDDRHAPVKPAGSPSAPAVAVDFRPTREYDRRVPMVIFTIGFTQTTAEHFFDRLRDAGVKRVVDIRLKNDSQLAGFAKARDLPYFLRS